MMNKDLTPQKSFWERPEGTPGMVVMAGLVLGAGYLIFANSEAILNAFQNVFQASMIGLGLFGLVFMLSDKKVRNLIWYLYKNMIRKATSLFVTIDPIGIIKVYIDELKTKRGKMNAELGKLKQEQGKLERKIAEQDAEMKAMMQKASVAKNKAQSGEDQARYKAMMSLNARKAGRRKNSTMKLTELLEKIKRLYAVMDKMYYYSGIMIEDTTDQVEVLESERNAIHASYGVMKAAQSIIAGNNDEAMMFDMAMQGIADDIGAKVGEMDRFMDLSQDFINGVDLDNGVFEEEGLEMLSAWEQDGGMAFLDQGTTDYVGLLNKSGDQPVNIPASNPQYAQYTEVHEKKNVDMNSKFTKLFDK